MNEALIEVNFPKLNHFWMDSGLLGLYRIAENECPEKMEVKIKLNEDGVLFKGTETNLVSFFHKAYNSLLSEYYNTSTEKQKQDNTGFYYDSKIGNFLRFPKVKPMGIAGLIFNKAPRPTKCKVKYEEIDIIESGKKIKKKILPKDYEHLQEGLDNFLSYTGLKISSSNLLLDGRNAIKPHIEINLKKIEQKGRCFICGDSSNSLMDIGGTVFPMISGSSGALSFNSSAGKPEKVCWKCDFVAKFVPVNGFYTMNKGNYHIYFPYSSNLEKMNYVSRNLRATEFYVEDPMLLRNFDNILGGYFQKSYEQLFAFLFSLYHVVIVGNDPITSTNEDDEINYENFGISLTKVPPVFFVMHTEALGDTQMGKMIWSFQNSIYLYRLLYCLEKDKINIKEIMTLLVDFEQKKNENKTIVRNRICERILKKQTVVELIEQHVFRVNKKNAHYIKPLNDFVIRYEKILNKDDGGKMKQELIDSAVSLGKTIGKSIGPIGKKGKGDLFRLRKTRKPEDFLNEINRIQMKYGTSVTADLYNKGHDFEENFIKFKQFCMISALNTFNDELKRNEKRQEYTK